MDDSMTSVEAPAAASATNATDSALQDDIKKHGENAYYYAHKRNIGPTSIRAYDEPVSCVLYIRVYFLLVGRIFLF